MRVVASRPCSSARSSKTISTNESKVPDSSPGPNTSRAASGRPGEASPQVSAPSPAGPMRANNCSKLRHSTAVLAALVMTAMPSTPTLSSTMLSIPFSKQDSFSESLIWREASEMSVSPSQNSLNPSPVPGPSTVTETSGATSSNSSATRIEIGSTVEEPEMVTLPDTAAGSGVLSLDELPLEPLPLELADPPDDDVAASPSLPQAAAISRKLTQMAGSIRRDAMTLRTKYLSYWDGKRSLGGDRARTPRTGAHHRRARFPAIQSLLNCRLIRVNTR